MDLNADVVLSDPGEDGVKVSEPVEGVVDKIDGEGLEGKGPKIDDSEVELGYLDRDNEEKGGIVSSLDAINGGEGREGLGGPRFGAGGVIGANEKGLVLESEDSFRSVDSSFGFEKDGGKYKTLKLKECAEDEVVSPMKSCEPKLSVDVRGMDELMREGKEEDVTRVGEIATGEKERGPNVEQGKFEEQSLDASSSMLKDAKLESLGPTGSVGEVTDDISVVDVKVVSHNESLHQKDMDVSTHSEMVTGDGLESEDMEVNVEALTNENILTCDFPDMAIDSDPNMRTNGNGSVDVNGKSTSSEPEYHDSDLVWGKVSSHPWWPGLICDPSAASKKAKKYSKKGTYLIAYFWDQTFAWNGAPRIKPFLEHFSQMEKQSNMEEFQGAIACALDEVTRRVEFGLACSCISKDAYAKLKTQIINNAGIREEASTKDGGDSSLSVAAFEPGKLVEFIKKSAKFPYCRVDRLEFVTSRAQLSAFYRWKGYSQLPEFNMLGGLLEEADILALEKKHCGEVSENAIPVMKDEDVVQKSKSKDNSSRKRKQISGDSTPPSKKEKHLPDVVAEKYLSTPMSENGSEGKAGSKLISQSSGKKRKAVDAMADDSAVKERKSNSSIGADSNCAQNKQTFRVGDRICRVASQLSRSSPILKNHNATAPEAAVEDEGKVKTLSEKPQLSLKQMFGKQGKKSTRTGKKSLGSVITEKSEPEAVPHEQSSHKSQNKSGELEPGAPTDKYTSMDEPSSSLELSPDSDSEQKVAGGDHESETVKASSLPE